MGFLRLLLALMVLLSHKGGFDGYLGTGGPVAVQAFYIISGFYMGLVLNERYDRPELNRVFYVNRLARVYPVYLAFLALYLATFISVQAATGNSPLWPYLTDIVPLWERVFLGLLNITVVGQDLIFLLGVGDGHLAWSNYPFQQGGHEVFRFMAIPPAWSLALEIYFYALAPFIARRSTFQILLVFAVSLAARIVAACYGVVGDPFSYRFFPFELALFLAGVLSYRMWAAAPQRWEGLLAKAWALVLPAALVGYPWLLRDASPHTFFTTARIGVLLLTALALPAVFGWTRTYKLDRQVGELSYPLYLGHLLVIGIVPATGLFAAYPSLHIVKVAMISLVVSWLVVRFIDSGIEAWRRRQAAQAGVADEILTPKAA